MKLLWILYILLVGLTTSLWSHGHPHLGTWPNAVNSQTDTLPVITKVVHGISVEVRLDGQFSTTIHVEDHEYPLRIWEAWPGVLYIQKYHVRTGYHEREERYFRYERRVMDRIEFYDTEQRLLSVYDVDAHNPYLNPHDSIQVLPYYFDSEGTGYWPDEDRPVDDGLGTYWVHTVVSGHGKESRSNHIELTYTAYEISKTGRMLGAKTTQVILDMTGREIFRKEFPYKTSSPVVANDGSHLLFSILPIETTENAGIKTQQEGFEIWDIRRKLRLYKADNEDRGMWVAEPVKDEPSGWLSISYSFPNSQELSRHQYLFDPETEILYDRVFTTEEINSIRRQSSEYDYSWYKVVEVFSFRKQNLAHE
jgi:hypothetical protein